jgi:hypothetical protein
VVPRTDQRAIDNLTIIFGHTTCRLVSIQTELSRLHYIIFCFIILYCITFGNVIFDATDQQKFAFVRYGRKIMECNETAHQLYIDFKKAYDLVRREVA